MYDGTNYLVTWLDQRSGRKRISGRRVTPAGTLLDGPGTSDGIAIDESNHQPTMFDVRFDGDEYVIVGAGYEGIFVRRLSPAGLLVDGTPEEGGVLIAAPGEANVYPLVPTISGIGSRSFVAWVHAPFFADEELRGVTYYSD
ncbi:MAG: hypothetical protein ACREQJ_17475 [Candidatus Binatia bacterium]